MKFRVLALFFAVGVTASFAQQGLFGPVTNHVKAGDLAPDLHFSKILSSPGGVAWGPSNLFGQITIIGFFGDTSHNPDNVSSWNAMVKKFAAQGVQFVWITDEKESSLLPFLAQHPIQGWLLLDPEKASGHEYGLDFPETVYVGADGKVLGFDLGFAMEPGIISAAVAGTISTDREKPGEHLDSSPWHMPTAEEDKPPFTPSYDLHVSPTQRSIREGTDDSSGDDFISLKGFTLKDAVARATGLTSVRISLPAELDTNERYDLAMVLPSVEDQDQLLGIFEQALLDHFHLSATTETRLLDVYVVTAPNGISAPGKASEGGLIGSLTQAGARRIDPLQPPSSLDRLTGISMEGTADDLCRFLETGDFDRPVVNETNSDVSFSFSVQATSQGKEKNDFLDRLREQTGLVIEPAQRNVDILAVRPR